jgi:hypothetical protein
MFDKFFRKPNRTEKEIIMTIEAQVTSMLAALSNLETAVSILTTEVKALSAPVPATVDLSGITTQLTSMQAQLQALLADVTDPADAQAQATPAAPAAQEMTTGTAAA